LALGRVMLRPGGDLPLVATSGSVLVVVDAGSLTLATVEGIVRSRRVGGPISMSPDVLLAPGDTATLTIGTGAIWRAGDDAPAELLVLTIMPTP
jgi:hypothetical protein